MKSYILDTNVLISLFSKHTSEKTKALLRLLQKNSVFYLCGFVLSEFYQGISKEEAEKYSALLDDFPYLPSQRRIYENAGLQAHKLRKYGKQIPLGDCVIGETARYHNAEIVTFDKHLRKYPGIKVRFLVLR